MLLTMLREVYAARRLEPPEPVAPTLVAHGPGAARRLPRRPRPVAAGRAAARSPARRIAAGDRPPAACAPGRCARRATGAISGSPPARRVLDHRRRPAAGRAAGRGRLRLDARVRTVRRARSRIVVNCGGARDGVAQLPAGARRGLRTTAAHSTLILGRQQFDRDPRRRHARPRRHRGRAAPAGDARTAAGSR